MPNQPKAVVIGQILKRRCTITKKGGLTLDEAARLTNVSKREAFDAWYQAQKDSKQTPTDQSNRVIATRVSSSSTETPSSGDQKSK